MDKTSSAWQEMRATLDKKIAKAQQGLERHSTSVEATEFLRGRIDLARELIREVESPAALRPAVDSTDD